MAHSSTDDLSRSEDYRPMSSQNTSNVSSPCMRPVHRRSNTVHSRSRSTNTIPKRPELLSFHQQSCQLFSSANGTLASKSSSKTSTPRHLSLTDLGRAPEAPSDLRTYTKSRNPSLRSNISGSTAGSASSNSITTISTSCPTVQPRVYPEKPPHSSVADPSSLDDFMDEKSLSPSPFEVTILSWTSNDTRRAEYAKIDRAYTGMRGLVKKVTPKCWDQCQRRRFHCDEGDKDDSDADSVRRIRLDLDEGELDEKSGKVKAAPEKVKERKKWFR